MASSLKRSLDSRNDGCAGEETIRNNYSSDEFSFQDNIAKVGGFLRDQPAR
jgi:hypothetical protein